MAGDKVYHIKWGDHSLHFIPRFKYFLETQKFVDITLECEGHVIKAHRVVLAASSALFEKILSDKDNISIIGVDFKVVYGIIEFIYLGQTSVSGEDLPPFLKLAQFLEIKGLSTITVDKVNRAMALHKTNPNSAQGENSAPPKVAKIITTEKMKLPVRTQFKLENARAYVSGGCSNEGISQMGQNLQEFVKNLKENPALNATNDSVRKNETGQVQIVVGDKRKKLDVKSSSNQPVGKRRILDEKYWRNVKKNKGFKNDHNNYTRKIKRKKMYMT